MHRRILAALLALAIAFAGCLDVDAFMPAPGSDDDTTSEGEDENGESTPPASPPTTPPPTPPAGTPPEDPPANRAPVAELTASPTTGEAPVNITFSIGATDPDGDDLTWTLDVGDGTAAITGDELPATHTHEYEEAGNYTVTLTVSDGELTDTLTTVVSITEPPAEVPTLTPQTGTLLVGTLFDPLPTPEEVGPYCIMIQDVNSKVFGLGEDRGGWIYKMAENEDLFLLRWFSGTPGHQWLIVYLATPEESPFLRYDETASPGIVPDGAQQVEVCLKGGLDNQEQDFSLQLWHPDDPNAPKL